MDDIYHSHYNNKVALLLKDILDVNSIVDIQSNRVLISMLIFTIAKCHSSHIVFVASINPFYSDFDWQLTADYKFKIRF